MWIARTTLKVGDEIRQYGDPIPEAEEWPNRQAFINTGQIEWVEDEPAAEPDLSTEAVDGEPGVEFAEEPAEEPREADPEPAPEPPKPHGRGRTRRNKQS